MTEREMMAQGDRGGAQVGQEGPCINIGDYRVNTKSLKAFGAVLYNNWHKKAPDNIQVPDLCYRYRILDQTSSSPDYQGYPSRFLHPERTRR